MKRTYSFKSIPMVPDPSGDAKKFSYDMNGVRDHATSFSASKFLLCPAWVPNVLLSLMAVALVFALAYGLLVIGMKVDLGGGAALVLFIIAAALMFVILWLALGIPAVLKRLKWDHVMKDRGKGNWKIVDDREWGHFTRMRRLEEERLIKEEEYRKARQ